MKMRLYSFFVLLLVFLSLGCSRRRTPSILGVADIDLDSICSRKKLCVVTDYNSVNYFVCKDVAVGYQYDMAVEYAKHLGVELQIVVGNDYEHNVDLLNSGKVDIIATSLIADTVNEGRMAFAEPFGKSRVVLVQRVEADRDLVLQDSLSALCGDTVALLQNSFYETVIENINDTMKGPDIVIQQIEHYDVEQIIQLVSEEEVRQTLALENIARANKWYYPNLDVATGVTPEYDLSWGVRTNAVNLKADIDEWLKEFKTTQRFKQIYRKYVIDPREHHSNVQKTTADTYKDDYEEIIRQLATDSRYDWLLISSVVYQESHFNPEAKSWAGARGLMQLMPETAKRFGVDDISHPEQNIEAGIKYLMWLDKRLIKYVPDMNERVKFALAAYNIGLGHIMDAIRLAEKQGMKPDVWQANVEVALLQKANAQFYSDPVVKHGYCRGTETINYVKNVMDRYYNYKVAFGKKKQ
ncbi:MAG: transglycosylase SLT domain-containing protein [Bacteroidales bacterium]|nr:transglycosylase SLT domain-containing protein [Bacteroidales bacterium]